jgi:hypothetical protein
MATDRGQLNTSILADSLGIDRSGRVTDFMDKITGISAVMFHQAEQFNRQITMMASYKLALSKYGDKPTREQMEAAANEAIYDTQEINGGSTLETGSRLAQKGIGRIALMYKNYGVQMYYTMLKTGKKLIDNTIFSKNTAENKRLRKEAFGQLVGIHLSGLFFAGVHGIPLYGVVTAVANLFLDEDEDDAETLTQKHLSDGWFKGGLSQLTGVDVSTRIGLSNLILRADKFNNNPTAEESFLYYFGGPAWSVGEQFYRGANQVMQWENPTQVERGMELMLPTAVRNAYRALVRVPRDQGYLTKKGDVIHDDLTFDDYAGLLIGFSPAEYTKKQQINSSFKRKELAIMDKRKKILDNLNLSNYFGDYELFDKYMDKAVAWNNKHGALFPSITIDVLTKSRKRSSEARNQTVNGLRISPSLRVAMEQHRSEYALS